MTQEKWKGRNKKPALLNYAVSRVFFEQIAKQK